jgi:hypothetical protein
MTKRTFHTSTPVPLRTNIRAGIEDLVEDIMDRVPNPSPQFRQALLRMNTADLFHVHEGLPKPGVTVSLGRGEADLAPPSSFRANERLGNGSVSGAIIQRSHGGQAFGRPAKILPAEREADMAPPSSFTPNTNLSRRGMR